MKARKKGQPDPGDADGGEKFPTSMVTEEGIVCPGCGCTHWLVAWVDRRRNVIRRMRQCRHCGYRVPTEERVAPTSGRDRGTPR